MSKLTSSKINLITIASGVVFALVAWLIISVFQHKSFFSIFSEGEPFLLQTIVGLFVGITIALVIIFIPLFSSIQKFGKQMIGEINPNKKEIFLVSFTAGVGEELLFRAAIQPFIGIWLTSLLFALFHGGLSFKKEHRVPFNIFLFTMSVLMGALYVWMGIIAAIVAHMIYNIVIMSYVQSKKLV